MTDTDKLKRLAEAMVHKCPRGIQLDRRATPEYGQAILALIAENERLRRVVENTIEACDILLTERDEAVALLRDHADVGNSISYWSDVHDFLARIDRDEEYNAIAAGLKDAIDMSENA